MTQPLSGGCQCGQLRYEIRGTPGGLTVCHCADCQKQSGSAFGLSLDVDPDDFHQVSGTARTFEWLCDSGRTKVCVFCPDCGSRIYHKGEWGISLKAGTLDDTSTLEPGHHVWTKRRQPWVAIPDGVSQCEDDG